MTLGAIGDRPAYLANVAYHEARNARTKLALRRAAEMAYLALVAAADAAACRLPPARLRSAPIKDRQPRNMKERGPALRRLEQFYRLPRKSITAEWSTLSKRLHGECFYNAQCRKRDVLRDIVSARAQVQGIMARLRSVPSHGC